MRQIFVQKAIKISASAEEVWEVLTSREYSDQWAGEFSSGGPHFHVESDWRLGSPVLWKSEDGRTMVEGHVTALETNKLLRFTVFDVRSPRPPVTDKDGITYELKEDRGKTVLHAIQGDFAVVPEGEKHRDLSAKVWDRVLPKIKKLAESQDFEAEEEERKYLIGS
jgi:uncharacterized protein YndB with AHSA1/START domain